MTIHCIIFFAKGIQRRFVVDFSEYCFGIPHFIVTFVTHLKHDLSMTNYNTVRDVHRTRLVCDSSDTCMVIDLFYHFQQPILKVTKLCSPLKRSSQNCISKKTFFAFFLQVSLSCVYLQPHKFIFFSFQ